MVVSNAPGTHICLLIAAVVRPVLSLAPIVLQRPGIMLERCIDYLVREGVQYSHTTHSEALTADDIASAETLPAHSVVSTAIYHEGAGYGLAVLPANRAIDLPKLSAVLGRSEVRLATDAETAQICPESEPDVIPPLGNLFGLPVLVDAEVANEPILVFRPGTRHDVIRITFADFRRLANPLIASFGRSGDQASMRTVNTIRSRRTMLCRRGPRRS